MAAEDRAKLRELLLPAATAILAPRTFDLTLNESGIQLGLEGRVSNIATAAEIADGTFKAVFTRRLCEAAGIETPKSAEEADRIPQIEPVMRPATRPSNTGREVKIRRERLTSNRAGGIPATIIPYNHPARSPLPKWVTEAVEMTGTVDPSAQPPNTTQPHSRNPQPVCVPEMRLTRRAQQILDEINERHREE
jgi:hypothetical protein